MTDTRAEEIIATCSAEFGTMSDAGRFHDRGIDQPDDGHQHAGPAAGDRGGQHDGRNEEDECDPPLGERKDRPVQRRRGRGQNRREARIGAARSFRSTATAGPGGIP